MTARLRFAAVTAYDPVTRKATVSLDGQVLQVRVPETDTVEVDDTAWLTQQGTTLAWVGHFARATA